MAVFVYVQGIKLSTQGWVGLKNGKKLSSQLLNAPLHQMEILKLSSSRTNMRLICGSV